MEEVWLLKSGKLIRMYAKELSRSEGEEKKFETWEKKSGGVRKLEGLIKNNEAQWVRCADTL